MPVPEFLPPEADHVAPDGGAASSAAAAAVAVDDKSTRKSGKYVGGGDGVLRFGPTRWMAAVYVLLNPATYFAVALFLFAISPHFREWLWNLLGDSPSAQKKLVEFWLWHKSLMIPLWIWFAAITALYAYLRVKTTNYFIKDGILIIEHGLLDLKGPSGPFAQYVDSIALSLVIDVNVKRGITEMLLGTGTLDITSRESVTKGGHAILKHVPNSERVRAALMDGSSVRDAKVIISG